MNEGPTPAEVGAAVKDYLIRTLAAGFQRDEEIVDAEFEEQAIQALPASTS